MDTIVWCIMCKKHALTCEFCKLLVINLLRGVNLKLNHNSNLTLNLTLALRPTLKPDLNPNSDLRHNLNPNPNSPSDNY